MFFFNSHSKTKLTTKVKENTKSADKVCRLLIEKQLKQKTKRTIVAHAADSVHERMKRKKGVTTFDKRYSRGRGNGANGSKGKNIERLKEFVEKLFKKTRVNDYTTLLAAWL